MQKGFVDSQCLDLFEETNLLGIKLQSNLKLNANTDYVSWAFNKVWTKMHTTLARLTDIRGSVNFKFAKKSIKSEKYSIWFELTDNRQIGIHTRSRNQI